MYLNVIKKKKNEKKKVYIDLDRVKNCIKIITMM